jgi:hypothetical protein
VSKEKAKKDSYNWSYENSINDKKRFIEVGNAAEEKYNAFRTNRSMSNFADTILSANNMNCAYWLDVKLQYDFYFYGVRKKVRRFKNRNKPEKDANFDLVQQYYKLSRKKTYDALAILTADQLDTIRKKMDKGGVR